MRKVRLIYGSDEYKRVVLDDVRKVAMLIVHIPYVLVAGVSSLVAFSARMVYSFCKEHTKVAVIIGYVLCVLTIIGQFFYYGLKLRESSDRQSELIKENYQLEQTDRYDIGYHDAMEKNSAMEREAMQND